MKGLNIYWHHEGQDVQSKRSPKSRAGNIGNQYTCTYLWLYRLSFWNPSLPSAPLATGRLSRFAIKVLIQVLSSSRYRHSISFNTNFGISFRFWVKDEHQEDHEAEIRKRYQYVRSMILYHDRIFIT